MLPLSRKRGMAGWRDRLTNMQQNIHDDADLTPSLLATLRLARSENLGPRQFHALVSRFGSATAALEALPELIGRRGFKKSIKICSLDAAKEEVAKATAFGAQLLSIEDERYPENLAALEDAPPILTMLGQLDRLQEPSVAIVGARNASALGLKFAETLARDLGVAGQTIVSGLARGVDTAAHRGSIETGTIAAIAGGIDQIYPPENRGLYEEIAQQGLLVTEMPFGVPPRAQHFPRRNRIISALSRATIVIEAAKRSGSLITARFALEQGRDVMAVPGSPLDPRCEGTNALISQGATLITSAKDVIEALDLFERRVKVAPVRRESEPRAKDAEQPLPLPPIDGPENRPPSAVPSAASSAAPSADNVAQQVLERLGPSPVEIDELIRRLPIAPNLILSTLLELEIEGKVTRHEGQQISRAG